MAVVAASGIKVPRGHAEKEAGRGLSSQRM